MKTPKFPQAPQPNTLEDPSLRPQVRLRLVARRRGFTIVELMMGVSIAGVLATLGTFSVRSQLTSAKSVEAVAMLGEMRASVVSASMGLDGAGLELGRTIAFGPPAGKGNGKGDSGSGNSGNGGGPKGDVDGDGNHGHGNNPGGCDPSNPGKSKNCSGASGSGSGSSGSGSDSGSSSGSSGSDDAGSGNSSNGNGSSGNGNGNSGNGGGPKGDVDGDGNHGHGNNPGGCDPSNPGNGKKCSGEDDGADGSSGNGNSGNGNSGDGNGSGNSGDGNGNSGNDNGGGPANDSDGDGNHGHGNNPNNCDPSNPGNGGNCSGSGGGEAVSEQVRLCGTAAPVPASIESVRGQRYQSSPSSWRSGDAENGWACLKMSRAEPQSYQYGYDLGGSKVSGGSEGAGSSFTAWARGDLDGDGRTSWFTIEGTVTGGQIVTSPQVNVIDPNE